MSDLGPFQTNTINGRAVGATDAASRIQMVRRFCWGQCEAALAVPGVQSTVVQAVGRRMRQLQREGRSPETDRNRENRNG